MNNCTTPTGESVPCIFARICGIPIWIESKNLRQFKRNARNLKRLTHHAEKAIRQLEEIRKLADALNQSIEPEYTREKQKEANQ